MLNAQNSQEARPGICLTLCILPPQVSVQRRETDRQLEARLKSYSHHAKQEAEEPWVNLQLHGAGMQTSKIMLLLHGPLICYVLTACACRHYCHLSMSVGDEHGLQLLSMSADNKQCCQPSQLLACRQSSHSRCVEPAHQTA